LNAFTLVDIYTKTLLEYISLLKGIFMNSAAVKGNEGVINVAILGGNSRLAPQ